MTPIRKLLNNAIDSQEVHRAARAMHILRSWAEIVGPILAEKSHPDRFDRGIVFIAVSGSSWAQELRLRQEDILNRLKSASGEKDLFKSLKFGVRRITVEAEAKLIEPRPPETRTFEQIIAERRAQLGINSDKKQRK